MSGEVQKRKDPLSFSLKDLIGIIVLVVGMASAWFMYDTRITVLEHKNNTLSQLVDDTLTTYTRENTEDISEAKAEIHALKAQIRKVAADEQELADIQRRINNIIAILEDRGERFERELLMLKGRLNILERK